MITLLRSFDDNLFTVHPNAELQNEDECLATFEQKTVES